MNALVTGATGFLGRRLVRLLLEQGWGVRCLARRPVDPHEFGSGGGGGRLEVYRGSLSPSCVDPALARGCDVVFHLAAALRGGMSVLFLTNVVAARALLEASARAGVGRFVLVSSLGVYGTAHLRPGDVLDERCPLDPEPHRRDGYSYSKIAQEGVAWESYRRGDSPLVVVRPAVIYGPGREVITNRVGLRLGDFVLQFGGRHRLPYTFVDNCAEGVVRAGLAPGVEGSAFNLVDDELPTGSMLVKAHRRWGGRVRVLTVPRAAVGPLSGLCEWYHRVSQGQLPAVLTRYKSDAQWKPLCYPNAAAKAALGWAPRVGLDEGLRQACEGLRPGRTGGPAERVPAAPRPAPALIDPACRNGTAA